MNTKERIVELDYLRAVCAIGIIVNHYTYAVDKYYKNLFIAFPSGNGSVGYMIVTVFFILSGILLYRNYENVDNIKFFYYKRFISIYPSFYLAYLASFIGIKLLKPDYFDKASPIAILLTIMGFDGYTSKYINNYYTLVGDWFLGIIITLYILYPIVVKIERKNNIILLVILTILFFVFIDWRMLNQSSFRNIFSCLFTFYLGMIIEKYQIYKKRYLSFASAFILLFLMFVKSITFINFNLLCHLSGICMFFLLFSVLSIVNRNSFISKMLSFIGSISYEIFLIQHISVVLICNLFDVNAYYKFWLLLLISILIIIVLSYVLKMICNYFINSVFNKRVPNKNI